MTVHRLAWGFSKRACSWLTGKRMHSKCVEPAQIAKEWNRLGIHRGAMICRVIVDALEKLDIDVAQILVGLGRIVCLLNGSHFY